jgi:2-polyprenyl-6-hydroxyphenyl methylase/3-demethylubiquinone-9 3-methyltransferase
MSKSVELLDQESHFAFGKNWASYSKLVTDARIEHATACLRRLADGDVSGKRFLDIGCGSGLHSLAALRLGAREVVALDLDPDSVATTRNLLTTHAAGERWSVIEKSIFEAQPESLGQFDVVYSWGVLHHTGDMLRALRTAATLVAPGGQFMFALYRRTALCGFWKHEKRWYAKASPAAQARARALYVSLFKLTHPRTFKEHVANYGRSRGMDFYHDVHDWLGGWPYESISASDVERFMQQLNMQLVRQFVQADWSFGVLGTGCDEYVYRRR